MEIGVFTFADVSPNSSGVHAAQRLPELVEEIELADQVGLDVFGIGEHHRPDFAAPSPQILLAAAAHYLRSRNQRALPALGISGAMISVAQAEVLQLPMLTGTALHVTLLTGWATFARAIPDSPFVAIEGNAGQAPELRPPE